MKIALCSALFDNSSIENNKKKIIDCVNSLSDDIDLVCFGEAFLQGFDSLIWNFENDKSIAISLDSYHIQELSQVAKENSIAIAFGYLELDGDKIFSSYCIISSIGEIMYNFRRISEGWKIENTDFHYCEGEQFDVFKINNASFTVGLCGDFWYPENCEKVQSLNTDIVLWPVFTDYSLKEWESAKYEYEEQSKSIGKNVLFINSLSNTKSISNGGAIYFKNGKIKKELLPGKEDILIVDI